MRENIMRIAAVAGACLLPSFGQAAADDLGLRLVGTYELPTGTDFEGLEFGGISAIDRASDGRYYALSDDRGGEHGAPRFYVLDIRVDETGIEGVDILAMEHMRQLDGTEFPGDARTVDPEGLRVAPNGNLYWSSEGNFSADPDELHQPFLQEMSPEGAYMRDLVVPSIYTYFDEKTAGGRSNKLFEALAVAPDGAVFLANEDALVEDGPITSPENGSRVRLTRFDPETGLARNQYAYELPPVPLAAAGGAPFAADNGLAELLALPDGSLLALERAFAWGKGNTIRLVHTAILPETTDILGIEDLADEVSSPMPRNVVLEMGPDYEGVVIDNMEGMSWGPDLPNGNPTLILVSDNNFSEEQRTLFMAFEVSGSSD
jgi:hypothetical protein